MNETLKFLWDIPLYISFFLGLILGPLLLVSIVGSAVLIVIKAISKYLREG